MIIQKAMSQEPNESQRGRRPEVRLREKTDVTSAFRPLISDFRSLTSFPLSVLFGVIWCSLVLFGPKIYFLRFTDSGPLPVASKGRTCCPHHTLTTPLPTNVYRPPHTLLPPHTPWVPLLRLVLVLDLLPYPDQFGPIRTNPRLRAEPGQGGSLLVLLIDGCEQVDSFRRVVC